MRLRGSAISLAVCHAVTTHSCVPRAGAVGKPGEAGLTRANVEGLSDEDLERVIYDGEPATQRAGVIVQTAQSPGGRHVIANQLGEPDPAL